MGHDIKEFFEEIWKAILVIALLYLAWKFNFIKEILYFVITIILGRIAWKLWIHYIQQDFISGIDFVLLEIIPPREVVRSPKAMELFFTNALYHWSEKGGKEEFWQGAVWLWFSLEIASIEGQVHFYIRTPTRIKGLIETQMYAQYPQAQVRVVDDYTLDVDEISPTSAWKGWGCEWALLKNQAFPIKTYVDFGLDKDPKEEFKVDPISPVIELFGSIGKGEQIWLQIVVTASKNQYKTPGTLFGTHDWVADAIEQIKILLKPYTRRHAQPDGSFAVEIRAPGFLEEVQKKMTLKIQKIGFETGIRLMYVAKKEAYQQTMKNNLRLIFRQYAAPYSNAFNRVNATQGDYYSGIFPASQKTIMQMAQRMLHEYQERGFFHLPLRHHLFNTHTIPWPFSGWVKAYKHPPTYVLNTEELATIWHFPGQILKVPTLERIESKEASPPTNLPT
jgi:hypothetical protein